jgi:hypothetical protein
MIQLALLIWALIPPSQASMYFLSSSPSPTPQCSLRDPCSLAFALQASSLLPTASFVLLSDLGLLAQPFLCSPTPSALEQLTFTSIGNTVLTLSNISAAQSFCASSFPRLKFLSFTHMTISTSSTQLHFTSLPQLALLFNEASVSDPTNVASSRFLFLHSSLSIQHSAFTNMLLSLESANATMLNSTFSMLSPAPVDESAAVLSASNSSLQLIGTAFTRVSSTAILSFATNITLLHCRFTQVDRFGLRAFSSYVVDTGSFVKVLNCSFRHVGFHAIRVSSNDLEVNDSFFEKCGQGCVHKRMIAAFLFDSYLHPSSSSST